MLQGWLEIGNTLLQDTDRVLEHVKETIREQTLQSLYKSNLTLLQTAGFHWLHKNNQKGPFGCGLGTRDLLHWQGNQHFRWKKLFYVSQLRCSLRAGVLRQVRLLTSRSDSAFFEGKVLHASCFEATLELGYQCFRALPAYVHILGISDMPTFLRNCFKLVFIAARTSSYLAYWKNGSLPKSTESHVFSGKKSDVLLETHTPVRLHQASQTRHRKRERLQNRQLCLS